MDELEPKQLVWIGSSAGTCGNLRRRCGALSVSRCFAAQLGETPPDAKPLKGFGGAGVLELIEDHRGRAVYTVRFATKILCAARVLEEIEARHRDSESRARAYPRAPEMGWATAYRQKAKKAGP